MSSIDERIVQMRFNNDQFQKGIGETTDSLTRLKEKLNLDSMKNSLSNLGASANNVSFDHLNNSVDTLASKFTTFSTAAVVALGNIASQAITTGLTMLKSLTVGPIIQGYQDYSSKLTSIQTITAATGKSIQEVEKYFNVLDTYADKTIYNLSDMTGALAKFTNAGVSLDTAVPAIKGISNMTALAGQDANAARIAYYNLSQSISGGFLTTIDYKSLNLANIATKEWKTQMINAGVAAGTLKKGANGLYNIPGSKKAYNDATLFTEGLSEQWASTKVLLGVLGDYGDETTMIGKKAQAAAQDVKSFGMMMETLKASVGTGWTDTFQIVIGNLDESKKLWTGLTSAIQEYIDIGTEARNNLLQGWKDLGGRTALIDAFGNVFKSIVDIFKAVSEAFKDIFPPTTSKQLYEITMAFKSFTDGLIMGNKTFDNLKRTLRGIFAIFGIVWEVVKAVGKAFFDLIGFTAAGSGGILKFTGNIGDFLYAIYKAIKAGDGLSSFFGGIADVIKIPIQVIKSFLGVIGNIADGLTNFSDSIVGTAAARMQARLEPFKNVGDSIRKVWENVTNVLKKVADFFKPVTDAVMEMFGGLGDTLSNAAKSVNYNSILDGVNTGLLAGLVLIIKKIFATGLNLDLTGGFFKNINLIFSNLTGTLVSFQSSLKAKTLLTIATAVALIAAAAVALSLVDSAKLTVALGALTVMFAQVLGSMSIFMKIVGAKSVGRLASVAFALILVSIAINILVTAVIRLAQLDWMQLLKGLTGLTVVLGLVLAFTKTVQSNLKGMISAGIGIIGIAIAIKILASAVSDFGSMSWENLVKGLAAVAAILVSLALFNKFASASKGAVKNAIGLILIAAAIKILASAVGDFAAIDTGKLIQGLAALTGILALLTIFGKVTSNGKSMIGTAIGLVILGAAMKIFASAIADLGAMSWDTLVRGLTGMAATLLIVAVAMRLMPTNMILTATGLVIVAAALTIMSNALKTFGSMTWDEIGRGLTVLAASLTILSIAMILMQGSIGGAAAMIIAAGAIAIMAPALAMLSKLSWAEIGAGLTMLAGSLIIIAAAGYLLVGAIPGLLGLGAAVLLVGIGMLAAGTGVLLFSAGLTALGLASVVGTAAIVTMVTALINLIPLIAVKIGEAIIEIANVIGRSGPQLLAAFTVLLMTLITAIGAVIPLLVKTVFGLINTLLTTLVENLPKFIDMGAKIIVSFIDGITRKLPDIIRAGTDLIIAWIKGIGTSSVRIVNAAFDTLLTFIEGITKAINKYAPKLRKAGEELALAIADGLTGGMASKAKGVVDGVVGWGTDMINGFKKQFGINSPSKVFMGFGQNMTQGLVNGLDDTAVLAEKSAQNVGQSAVDGLTKAISNISDMALSTVDMNPTIKPVLDLSAVEKDSLAINSMLTPSTISVDTAYNQAASISADQQAAKSATDIATETSAKTGDTNISFIQTNNSPKALTPAEIYRQTKNQISAAKGTFSIA